MVRFTLAIPIDLNAWIESQAQLNNRSKHKQIRHFLEQLRNIPQSTLLYQTGSTQLCNTKHHWIKPNPATSEPCNCGHYVFGEVVR